MGQELLPCVCGGEAEMLGFGVSQFGVRCTSCGTEGPRKSEREDAQAAWNAITPADKLAASKAFDIAFRGDTENIDADMEALFADHRIAAAALNQRQPTTKAALQEGVERLFEAIKHGDEDHQAWLREAIAAHFAGEPVPEPRGQGRKDALIAELQAKLSARPALPDDVGELIERLRECATVYEKPPFRDEHELRAHTATASMMREAGDALEAFAAHQEEWKPIEEAPRDGTPIIVTNSVRGGSWVAQYSERYASGLNKENPWSSLMLNLRWHENQYASTIPTHFRPLPDPPRGDKPEVGLEQKVGRVAVGARACAPGGAEPVSASQAEPLVPRAGDPRDPSDCRHCDGFGMCWNNADPTSCQWQPCSHCGDTRGHP